MDARLYTLSELADIDIDLWVNAMGELADRHGDEIDGFKDDRNNCPAEYEAEFVQFAEDKGIHFDEHGHILNAAVIVIRHPERKVTVMTNDGGVS